MWQQIYVVEKLIKHNKGSNNTCVIENYMCGSSLAGYMRDKLKHLMISSKGIKVMQAKIANWNLLKDIYES